MYPLPLSVFTPSYSSTHTHIAPLFVAGVTLRISWLNGNVNCRVIACNCTVNSRHSVCYRCYRLFRHMQRCCCCDTCHTTDDRQGVSLSRFASLSSAILLLLLLLLVLLLWLPLFLLSCLLLSTLISLSLPFPSPPALYVSVCCAFIKRHSCMAPHATICERLK